MRSYDDPLDAVAREPLPLPAMEGRVTQLIMQLGALALRLSGARQAREMERQGARMVRVHALGELRLVAAEYPQAARFVPGLVLDDDAMAERAQALVQGYLDARVRQVQEEEGVGPWGRRLVVERFVAALHGQRALRLLRLAGAGEAGPG